MKNTPFRLLAIVWAITACFGCQSAENVFNVARSGAEGMATAGCWCANNGVNYNSDDMTKSKWGPQR
jgi:hypothetical protein